MAIAKTGKIASSTGNYGSTGNALDKSSANGFVDHDWDVITNSITQLFAPNLNLGVSMRDTVVPTVAGYTSYTNGPGLGYGGLGYKYTFTEDMISIVTPDAIPTNPNLGSHAGLSFNRYEVSTTDFMRGAQSCIVIGSDFFTPNNYVNGGFDTPGYDYMSFGPYQTFIGKNNFKGLGSSEIYGGYVMEISSNTFVGSNNFNAMVDQNGTFINTYISEGNNGYGVITEASGNVVLGKDNVANSLTKRPNGYGAGIYSNVIVGNDNATTRSLLGGTRQLKTNSKDQYYQSFNNSYRVLKQDNFSSNYIFGSGNFGFVSTNKNNFDGTYEDYPFTNINTNFVFGSGIGYGYVSNWFAAGSGDQSGFANTNRIENNLLLGYNIKFNTKVKSELTVDFEKNVILNSGGYGGSGSSNTNITSGIENVFIGGACGYNNSGDTFSQAGKSEFQRNVFIGNPVVRVHGSSGAASMISDCVVIGAAAQPGGAVNLDNVIVIGAGAAASTTSATNEITLGNASIAALRCNVTSITALSDARDKTNIEPISNASAFIKDLKPVKFDWNRRDGVKAKEHDMGFLAQDLDEAQSKHGIQNHLDIVYKSNPEALEASYGKLLPILVQALKEQQEEIEKLKSTTN